MRGLPIEEHERRRLVYEETLSDREAAEGLCMGRVTFRSWRRRAGLPVKPAPASPPTPKLDATEEARRRDAWEFADSDEEAAWLLGISRTTFMSWRAARGLANKRTGCVPGQGWTSPAEERRRLDAWAASASLREAAERLGITHQSMEGWARRRGIPSPQATIGQARIGYSDRDLRIWQAFCTSLNDRESANKLGIGPTAMRRWRIRNGFPDHRRTPTYWERMRREARNGNPVAAHHVRKRFPQTHNLDDHRNAT